MPPKCKPAGPTTPNRLCTEVHAGQGGRSLSRRLRTHERAFQRAGIASGLVDSTGSAELRVNSGVAKMSLEKLVLAVIAAAVLIFLAITWQEARNDRVRLESTIDAQQRIIAAAVSSEKERETTLQTALAQIAAIKKSTQTPEQVLSALPEYLHLPEPITLSRSSPPAASQSGKGTPPTQTRPSSRHRCSPQSPKLTQPPAPSPSLRDPNQVLWRPPPDRKRGRRRRPRTLDPRTQAPWNQAHKSTLRARQDPKKPHRMQRRRPQSQMQTQTHPPKDSHSPHNPRRSQPPT